LDHHLSFQEKLQSLEILTEHILPRYSRPTHWGPVAGLDQYSIVTELIGSLLMNMGKSFPSPPLLIHFASSGRTFESLSYYQSSYFPLLYASHSVSTHSWKTHRDRYRLLDSELSSEAPYKTWYFTIATHVNSKLQNLLLSAEIAGIEIQVLGLGLDPSELNKVALYHDAVHERGEVAEGGRQIQDDDVIVLLDGYDLIVTPAARYIGQVSEEVPPSPSSLHRLIFSRGSPSHPHRCCMVQKRDCSLTSLPLGSTLVKFNSHSQHTLVAATLRILHNGTHSFLVNMSTAAPS
jgi:hypothetical protein